MNIQDFCSTDRTRYLLCKPWCDGEHIWASDGRVGIRIPANGQPADPEPNKSLAALPGLIHAAIKDVERAVPIPELRPIEFEPCSTCKGTGLMNIRKCHVCGGDGFAKCDMGHEHECEDCEDGFVVDTKAAPITCDECDGDKQFPKMKPIKIGLVNYNDFYLAKFSALPGVRIIPNGYDAAGILFDGGEGAIMPTRTP